MSIQLLKKYSGTNIQVCSKTALRQIKQQVWI